MQRTVLLVDDHPVFRKGLYSLLEDEEDVSVVGEAGDGQRALELIAELSPDIVVMDVTMPGMNGIEATKRIVSEFPDTKIVALSIHSEKQFVQDMLHAGAAGYILKESVPEELVKGIRAVMLGEGYLSPAITGLVVSAYKSSLSYDQDMEETRINVRHTKFQRPSVPNDHIHRQRLVEQLDRHRDRAMTLVSAPAGYGKSLLVSCWLEESDWPNAWLSLSADENDLHTFLIYFMSAVQNAIPGVLPITAELLDTIARPPLSVLARSLRNELNLIDQDFILVLDDFHYIQEKSLHDLLSEVMRHPPRCMHLVLISRRDPFLPISNLRAGSQLSEIHLQDLRFTAEETAVFMQRALGREINQTTASEYARKTEGWVTGLRLAALGMKWQKDLNTAISELSVHTQQAREYLFNQVVATQTPAIRHFLLCTSMLDRFCAPLCEAVFLEKTESGCHEMSGWDFIAHLSRENMFIIPLDSDNRWFRYHHLFQSLLQNQLKRHHTPEAIAALHSRASQWFESRGLIKDAIEHALARGDVEDAADIFDRHRRAEQDAERWRIIEKWLTMFPTEFKRQRRGLLLAQAWIFHDRYELGKVSSIVEQLESIVDDAIAESVSSGELHFFHGVLLFWQGQGEASLKHLMEARRLIPQAHPRITGLVEIYIGLGRQMIGQRYMALQELIERSRGEISLRGEFSSRLFLAQALIHAVSGDLERSARAAQLVEQVSKKLGIPYMYGWGLYMQAASYFRSQHLEAASEFFAQVIEKKYLTHTRIVIDSLAGLALAHQAMQRPDAAAETSKQLLDFALETEDSAHVSVAHSALARISLTQGDLDSASRWVQSFNEVPRVPEMFIWLEIPSITQIRVWIAIGSEESLQKAAESLQALRPGAEALHNTCQAVEIMVLQSVALKKLGRADESRTVLEEAVGLAETGGWIQPFVELGPPMADLLKKLIRKNVAVDYTGKLLAAFREGEQRTVFDASDAQSAPVPSSPRQPLVGSLTDRELEVLELAAERFSNKEIAEKLFISIETVKTHLSNIYQTLNAGNRRQAVTIARSMGILESH